MSADQAWASSPRTHRKAASGPSTWITVTRVSPLQGPRRTSARASARGATHESRRKAATIVAAASAAGFTNGV